MAKNKSTAEKIIDNVKQFVPTVLSAAGIKKENIGGTPENEQYVKQLEQGLSVMANWQSMDTVYNELLTRLDNNRNFYLGEDYEQGVSNLEGNEKVIANLGATVIDLFTYILTNNPPSVQFAGDDAEPVAQAEANFKEELTRRLLSDCHFQMRFRDGGKNQFTYGYAWLYPFWNTDNKLGGKKGTFDLTLLNPFTSRVKFKNDDADQVELFITSRRMSPAAIQDKYSYTAIADSEDPNVQKTIQSQTDGMTTVYTEYSETAIRTIINSRQVKEIIHGLGFCPLIVINNIRVANDMHGHSEIERWQDLLEEVNALLSAASEIARDLAYPPIIEYNNALGGRSPGKWRGMKIPAKRSDKGESIAYMNNPAQITPLIKQTEFLIQLFHFIALMPQAAGGIFAANVTSGFQAKLAMQPATLTTDSRKIDWEVGLKMLVRMAFKILEKYNPEALTIETDGGKTVKISEIYDHEMQVVWPQNLPIDIAREIQNLILGIQNNLTSLHQAIDRYNVLMGLGSPEDTEKFLKQEADDPTMGPERAMKVKEVQAKIGEILQGFQGMNQKLDAMRQGMGTQPPSSPTSPAPPTETTPGMTETVNANNPTNLARAATAPLPGEQRTYPPTREAVNPNSTGGKMVKVTKTATPKGFGKRGG